MCRVVNFYLTHNQTLARTSGPPLGNFLESQSEEDFCLVSLSACDDQIQRGHCKQTRDVPSAQRRVQLSGCECASSFPRFLLPGLALASETELRFSGELSGLPNVSGLFEIASGLSFIIISYHVCPGLFLMWEGNALSFRASRGVGQNPERPWLGRWVLLLHL